MFQWAFLTNHVIFWKRTFFAAENGCCGIGLSKLHISGIKQNGAAFQETDAPADRPLQHHVRIMSEQQFSKTMWTAELN